MPRPKKNPIKKPGKDGRGAGDCKAAVKRKKDDMEKRKRQEFLEKLVNEIRERDLLWDRSLDLYSNRNARKKAWIQVANEMGGMLIFCTIILSVYLFGLV
jgi:hypothetical protein